MKITELLHLNTPLEERYKGYALKLESEGLVAESYEEWLENLLNAQGRILTRLEQELQEEGHETLQSFLTRNLKKPKRNYSHLTPVNGQG